MATRVRGAVVATIAVVAGAAAPPPARASEPVVAFAGASAGVAAGAGDVSDHGDVTAVLAFRGGAMWTPRVAVYAEGWMRVCVDDRALGAGARTWPVDGIGLWVGGGVGVARRSVSETGACFPDAFKRSTGGWATAQVGVELLRRTHYAVDVSLRLNASYYPEAYRRFIDDEPARGVTTGSAAIELGISLY